MTSSATAVEIRECVETVQTSAAMKTGRSQHVATAQAQPTRRDPILADRGRAPAFRPFVRVTGR